MSKTWLNPITYFIQNISVKVIFTDRYVVDLMFKVKFCLFVVVVVDVVAF